MAKRKSPEQKLVEAVKEMGMEASARLFISLEHYFKHEPTKPRVRKPKLAKSETA